MSDANEQVFIAAATGNLDKLQAALAAGGDPSAPSADGRTPLVMAARAGHVDSIRALVGAGADPGAAAGIFGTPLGFAASEGHLDAVRALVELGAPLDPRAPEESAPLVSAVDMDDPEILRYLVSAGASIEQTNRYGQTALIVSAIQGKARAAAALLELGASREARDRVMGQTALEHAGERGHERLVALLSGAAVPEETAAPEEAPRYRSAAPSGRWLELDGVALADDFDYDGFVQRLLAGREAIGLRDIYPCDRLERLWTRLGTAQDALSRAAARCLTDPSALVRSQALMFFRERPQAPGAERVEELAADTSPQFAGVADPIQTGVDLQHGLLAALAARARLGVPGAVDLARRLAGAGGSDGPLRAWLPDTAVSAPAPAAAPAAPAAEAAPAAPAKTTERPRVGPPTIAFITPEGGAAPEGTAAEIAAALEQPAGPQRTKRLYDLGVRAFREAAGDGARLGASVWMARALHAAAEAGHPQAWVEVGRCLFNGWGVTADPPAAVQAYGHAADLGSDEGAYAAAFNLYWAFQRDAEAHAYVRQATAGRDPSGEAHYLAGLMAHAGRGRSRDDAEALRLQTEAARRGNADALFELHVFHAKGIGCAVDEARAAECLRAAAQKDHPRACYTMGAFHATGRGGFEKDDVEAAEWYRRASAAGHGKAAATLGVMHMTGQGAPFYPARGRALLSRATELGFDGPGMAAAVGVDEAALDAAEEWFDAARAAIGRDDLDALRALVQDGPPVDMVGRSATTLLSVAAREGKGEAAAVLVGAGASPSGVPLPRLVGPDGTPLVLALKQRHFDVAERLLALGADVNANVPYHGGTLNSFTKNEEVDAARWLLDHGADPERRSSDRCTPLMTAAREGQEVIVRLLLERGADANAFKPIDFGLGVVTKDSALAMATYSKHKAIVKALKAAGATE